MRQIRGVSEFSSPFLGLPHKNIHRYDSRDMQDTRHHIHIVDVISVVTLSFNLTHYYIH